MDGFEKKHEIPRGIRWALIGLGVFFAIGFVASFFYLRDKAKTAVAEQSDGLQSGISDLQRMDFSRAAARFSSISSSSKVQSLAGIASFFGNAQNPISAVGDLPKRLAEIANELSSAQGQVFGFLAGQPSPDFIVTASSLRDTLHAIDGDIGRLTGAASFLGVGLPGGQDFLALQAKLNGAENFLDALTPWLSASSPHHVLVLLQNPSELRATGGFLGSYADVTIASGTIANVGVHDIADADAAFTQNIIPPQPLQLEGKRWRPADSNWFFDFPTSASETLWFFDHENPSDPSFPSSSVPATIYDGVIAVSPKIIHDLLGVTGPVAISSPTDQASTTFTADNFFVQIQSFVQAGQAAQALGSKSKAAVAAAQYPKQVLRDLFDGIFARLATLSDTQKQDLLGLAKNWLTKKDVTVYFKDPAFENFAKEWGVSGGVFQAPQDFEGDYLALVNTNINGQKSDLYISEDLNWQSQINADGSVDDQVAVIRKHAGDTSSFWWYRAQNQEYVQLFTPSGSSLTNESGGIAKKIASPIDYAKQGYSTDPLIASIESTTQPIFGYDGVTQHEESGKTVFATWSSVPAGSSTLLSFSYSHRLYLPPGDGRVYTFVFDKQPGTVRHYSFEIDAPLGYQFAETNLPSWIYVSDDVPARLSVNLTLLKK